MPDLCQYPRALQAALCTLFCSPRTAAGELPTRARMIRTEPHDTSASGAYDFAALLSLQTTAKNE